MMRRIPDVPVGGWLLNGVRYQSEAEYRAALDKRNARRARLAARDWVECGYPRGYPKWASPSAPVEAVRRYCELLAPFWSAEHGWSDPWWFGEREWSDVDVPDGLERRR
jgi:hypothetical protein